MDTRSISQSDINRMANNVESLAEGVYGARESLSDASAELQAVDKDISQFKSDFDEFLRFDKAEKELLLAKTRIVSITQRIQESFGQFDTVRRHVLGILQATDAHLVQQETMQIETERLMTSCPSYWLVPCLLALVAWIRDDLQLAERATLEAIARDDEKTSLLFALICRRANRPAAVASWLERYFGMQDPKRVERKLIVVLDAYTNGIFGQEARTMCASKMEGWMLELAEIPGFVEDQQQRWLDAFMSKRTRLSHTEYRYLPEHADNWEAMSTSLDDAALHQSQLEYFKAIFEAPPVADDKLREQLDDLLESYVTNFDAEELPLRQEKLFTELIIEEGGHVDHAEKRFELMRQSMDEVIDFSQLLTNAAMHPDQSHASKATQKLSIALSREWIVGAYETLAALYHARVPQRVELNIATWQGDTADGENEKELEAALEADITQRKENAVAAIKQQVADYVLLIAGLLLFLVMAVNGNAALGLLVAVGAVLKFVLGWRSVKQKRAQTAMQFDRVLEESRQTLRACCAEICDYWDEFRQRDARYGEFTTYLRGIVPDQQIKADLSGARTVLYG